MFLNSTPLQYTPRAFYAIDNSLIDNDVNYYDFQKSKEYRDWMESIKGQTLTMDMYDSPYFGMQSSGAYRELDRIYEAYRARFVDLDDIRQPVTVITELKRTDASPGISPMLILAAVAAYFIAG